MRFFSFAYSSLRCCFVSSSYRGILRRVKNFRRTTSIVFLEINLYSSNNKTWHLLPLAESLAVTTLIVLVLWNTTCAFIPFILVSLSFISAHSSGDKGLSSSSIFSRTFAVLLYSLFAKQHHIFRCRLDYIFIQ